MATAWTTTEKQVTGEVQYVIATGDDLGAATSVAFDVSGYTQGSIAAINANGGTITINGSNDANTTVTPPTGGNYFILTPAVTFAAGVTNVITWTTPVKTITITATLGGIGLFTDITVMATAGGSGGGGEWWWWRFWDSSNRNTTGNGILYWGYDYREYTPMQLQILERRHKFYLQQEAMRYL